MSRRRTYSSASKGRYDYEGVLCVDYNYAIWSSSDGKNWTKLGTMPSTMTISCKINGTKTYTFSSIKNIVWLHDDTYAFLLGLIYGSSESEVLDVVEGTIDEILSGKGTRKFGTDNDGTLDMYLNYAHRFHGTNKSIFGVTNDRSDGLSYSEWLDLPSDGYPNYVDMNDNLGDEEDIINRIWHIPRFNSSCIYDGYIFSRLSYLATNSMYIYRHPVKGGWSNYLECYTYLKTYAGDYSSECYEICYCNDRFYVGVREYDDSDGTIIYRIYYTDPNPSSGSTEELSTRYTSVGGWLSSSSACMFATDTEVHIYRDGKHYALDGTSLSTISSGMTSPYPSNFGIFRYKDVYISSYDTNNVIYSTDLNTWTAVSQSSFYPRFFVFVGETGEE